MHRTLTALALWLALAGGADATTLSTGMLLGPSQTSAHVAGTTWCFFTNLGSRAVEATVRILSNTGAPVDVRTVSVGSGESLAAAATGISYARCEFQFSGSARSIRASGCAALGPENCIAIEPAR